ncbi:MAG: oxidoreductase [Cytophagales bacterium]|nr:oxidoreductase [Cytophagales bacterium]
MKKKMSKSALLIGASGLVGNYCLNFLLENPAYEKVTVITRRTLPIQHSKLVQVIVDFDHLNKYSSQLVGEAVFCCLGTTIKVAGSKDNFFKVDYTYVLESAKLAIVNGAKEFYLVSSMGADATSMIFYSKVKGQIENALKNLGYASLYIFRPSLLLGDRTEHRAGEKLGIALYNLLKPIFVGPLKKYRGIEAKQVAFAMVKQSTQPQNGIFTLESDMIQVI